MAAYASLAPTGDPVKYVPNYQAANGYYVEYPDSDSFSTFGPVLTPKVWADGLDTLELASSGRIAATLNNEHAFDMSEADSLVKFTARDGNSFRFQTEQGQASVTLSADLSNVSVFSSNSFLAEARDFALAASGAFTLAAHDEISAESLSNSIALAAKVDFRASACNDVAIAAGNDFGVSASRDVSLLASLGDVEVGAGQNISMSAAFGKVSVASAGDTDIASTSGTVSIKGVNMISETLSSMTQVAAANWTASAGALMTQTAQGPWTAESAESEIRQTAATDWLATASSNVLLTAVTGSVTQAAGSNWTAAAAADVGVSAMSNFSIAAANDGRIAASNRLFIASDEIRADAETFQAVASGDMLLESKGGNVSIEAPDVLIRAVNQASFRSEGDFIQYAGAQWTGVASSNIDMSAGGSVTHLAGADLTLESACNSYAKAGGSHALEAGGSMSFVSELGAQFTSTDGDLLLSAPNGTLTLEAAYINLGGSSGGGLVSQSDVGISSVGSNVNVDAGMGVTVDAGADIVMAASNAFSATASNDVAFRSLASNVNIDAGNDVVLTAARDINRFSARDIGDSASNDFRVVAGNDASVTADSNVVLTTLSRDISLVSARNVGVTAGGDLLMSAATAMAVDADSMSLTSRAGNMVLGAGESNKQVFQIGGVDIIEVFKTEYYNANAESNATAYTVRVNADFEIQGGVNTIGVNQTVLQIEDKTIKLSHHPDDKFPFDGPLNSRSGIIVDGAPESWALAGEQAGTGIPLERFEKSFTWNTPGGDGVRSLGDGSIANEAFWELRGGHLKLTHVDEATGDQVSFGFRIGDSKELELYKYDSTTNRTHRCARFGRVM